MIQETGKRRAFTQAVPSRMDGLDAMPAYLAVAAVTEVEAIYPDRDRFTLVRYGIESL
jgi:hypothetical protein